jgi:hypothetical protein
MWLLIWAGEAADHVQCLAGVAHQLDAAFDFGIRVLDRALDLLRRLG